MSVSRAHLDQFRIRLYVALFCIGMTGLSRVRALEADLAPFEARQPVPAEVFQKREGKKVACFITINSSDEKETFTKYLDPEKWDLVELASTQIAGSSRKWFENACATQISCDVNVVSGHFAKRFFGSSRYSLTLEELETHSCAQDCAGILNHPKEVYLFGCNTLAGKERDSRTPEQYYDVLVADGYSQWEASQVVEDRYGAFGQDNRGKMRRAFAGVPYLYGFDSKGPLGKHARPYLEKYFEKIGDFTAHIDAISDQKKTALSEPNKLLADLMGSTFAQCPGITPDEPEYELHKKICALFNKTVPISARMKSVEEMLSSEKILSVLPYIESFLRQNIQEIAETESASLKRIQANEVTREKALNALEGMKTPVLRIQWLRFGYMMTWVNEAGVKNAVHEIVRSTFAEAAKSPEIASTICSLSVGRIDQYDFADIVPMVTDAHFKSVWASRAMACLGLPRYPEFRTRALQFYSRDVVRSRLVTQSFASTFADGPVLPVDETTRLLSVALRNMCISQPLGGESPLCGQALVRLASKDPEMMGYAASLLKDATSNTQLAYMEDFQLAQAALPELEDAFLEIYLKNYRMGMDRYFIARPPVKTENRLRLLKEFVVQNDGRAPDELLFALRETKLTPPEFNLLKNTVIFRRKGLLTQRAYTGLIGLASVAGSEKRVIEDLLTQQRQTLAQDVAAVKAFTEIAKRPAVRSALKRVCKTFGPLMRQGKTLYSYDDFGKLSQQSVEAASCE